MCREKPQATKLMMTGVRVGESECRFGFSRLEYGEERGSSDVGMWED